MNKLLCLLMKLIIRPAKAIANASLDALREAAPVIAEVHEGIVDGLERVRKKLGLPSPKALVYGALGVGAALLLIGVTRRRGPEEGRAQIKRKGRYAS